MSAAALAWEQFRFERTLFWRAGTGLSRKTAVRRGDWKVLIDDRPVPYARQLWLPLVWFFIQR